MRYFEIIGDAIIPKKIRPVIHKYLTKAGISKVPYNHYGIFFHISLILSFFIFSKLVFKKLSYNIIILIFGTLVSLVIINIILLIIIGLILKFYYDMKIFKRTEQIEAVWPEYLEAVRINLQAGSTFDKALLDSVESRFGVLEREIEIVAKKEMTGEDTVQALKEFADKYNSNVLHESVDLLILGLTTGVRLSDILKRVVESVNLNNYLKKEAINSVLEYVFFITLIACIISPALFALSFNLLTIFEGFSEKLGAVASELLSFSFEPAVNKEHFIYFSRFSLVVISLFSAGIIANLKKGSLKGGIKYVPVFIAISIIVYEIARWGLTLAFGKLF